MSLQGFGGASSARGIDASFSTITTNAGIDCAPGITGDLFVRGGATIKKTLCVRGNTVIKGNVSVNGDLNVINPTHCFVRNSTADSLNDGDTLTYNVVDSDSLNMLSSPSTITIPKNGVYIISVSLCTLGPDTAISIYVNGSSVANADTINVSTLTVTLPLNIGDVISTKFQFSSPITSTTRQPYPLSNYLIVTKL